MKDASPPITFLSKRNNQILIRVARAEDVNPIWALFNEVVSERQFIPTLAPVRDLFEQQTWYEETKRTGGVIMVATKGDEFVGYCTIERCKDEASQHCGILGILVKHHVRNEGIGQQLIFQTIQISKMNKFKKISLSVFNDNEPAIQLYKKMGFKIVGRREQQFIIDGKCRDEILMDLIIHSDD